MCQSPTRLPTDMLRVWEPRRIAYACARVRPSISLYTLPRRMGQIWHGISDATGRCRAAHGPLTGYQLGEGGDGELTAVGNGNNVEQRVGSPKSFQQRPLPHETKPSRRLRQPPTWLTRGSLGTDVSANTVIHFPPGVISFCIGCYLNTGMGVFAHSAGTVHTSYWDDFPMTRRAGFQLRGGGGSIQPPG